MNFEPITAPAADAKVYMDIVNEASRWRVEHRVFKFAVDGISVYHLPTMDTLTQIIPELTDTPEVQAMFELVDGHAAVYGNAAFFEAPAEIRAAAIGTQLASVKLGLVDAAFKRCMETQALVLGDTEAATECDKYAIEHLGVKPSVLKQYLTDYVAWCKDSINVLIKFIDQHDDEFHTPATAVIESAGLNKMVQQAEARLAALA